MKKICCFLAILVALTMCLGTVEAAPDTLIQGAIDDGLAWLAAKQNTTPGPGFGSWGTSYRVGKTGLAVKKFEHDAILRGYSSPFDPAYLYHLQVERGLNYLFANALIAQISMQTHGDPDTDGDGIGVYFTTDHETYQTGIALMAIAESNTPNRVVDVPGSPVDGWTYYDVAVDIMNWLAYAQTDFGTYEGGWWYGAMNNSGTGGDQSNSGYATLGLAFSEASSPEGFGLSVPQFVKDELNVWIDYIQIDADGSQFDGGSAYYQPGDTLPGYQTVNILETGNLLFEMAWYGDNSGTQRVQDAIDYIVRHWTDGGYSWPDPQGWHGSYQAMFTVMKGLEAFGIDLIDGIDWFDEISDTIVATQHANGSWGPDVWDNWVGGDTVLSTCWALLTLQKVSPPLISIVWIPDTCVYPGKMNCIPVYLDSLPPWGVYSAQMVLLYDETVIQANHAKTENSIAEAWGDPTYNIGTGWIAIAMAGIEALDTTGVLVWVCFDVVGDVGDSTLLEFEDDHAILNDSAFKAKEGIIRVCPEEYGICGRVRYCLNDEPIDSAKMMLSGGKDDTVYTNANGMYKFLSLPAGLDYLVRGDKADDDRGAISAFDASLVLRYVVRLLDLSGCQMIAGDVTGNCWLNAYDASFILKYVVGLIPQFPIGKDWKFIPADFALDTLNWCAAPDSIFYDSLSEDKCCEDWMGILYGDLTGNWDNLLLVGRDSQQDILSRLAVKEILVNPGEEFVVPIQVENISDVYAVELNLSYDNSLLSLAGVKPGELLEGYYFEKNLTSGEIRLAMAGAHPICGSGALAYLTFKVLPQAQEGIATQLQVDRICLNEASAGGFAYSIGIGSGGTSRPLEFGLSQNYPNPFNPETEIGFSVPVDCQVELKIYNIAGQLVKVYQGDYGAGAHSISWDGTNMRGKDVGSGIYFYRMEAGKFVQQRKMVLMR